jgi:hypothetical protein
MSHTLLFWPAFAQVVLILIVMVTMGRARAGSMKARKQSMDDVALNRPTDWDEASTKAANNYKNHFEMPVLFFAAIGYALALKIADPVLVVAAWAFVAARVVQTAIHLGPNIVAPRALSFLLGVLALIVMWGALALQIARASS